VATELERLARTEPPVADLRLRPVHAERYLALAARLPAVETLAESFGPAFTFPDSLPAPTDTLLVTDEAQLERHFRGWQPGEIAAGREPVVAIIDRGDPVSICFCARSSNTAAEAGLETPEPYRRRGFGARVAAAWATAVRATGRVPLYSTAWNNDASMAVACKLNLNAYACDWSIVDGIGA